MSNQQIKQSNVAVAASSSINNNNSSNANSNNSKLPPSRSNSLSRNKNVPELVRMLHKTKLTYSHDFESENNYAWNANFLAENFDPHDPGTIQIAYWILKTMTFKSDEVPLPYKKLLKLCLEMAATLDPHAFATCKENLMKMLVTCARKVFKAEGKTDRAFFIKFDYACQKLITQLIGFSENPNTLLLSTENFDIKTALDEISMDLYTVEESMEFCKRMSAENIEQVFYALFRLHCGVMSSKCSFVYKPDEQEQFMSFYGNYIQYVQKYPQIPNVSMLIINDLITFLHINFSTISSLAANTQPLFLLSSIVALACNKPNYFSKEIVLIVNDPLTNLVSLLSILQQLKAIDQIFVDEAAIALQKALMVIAKDSFERNFFMDYQTVSEMLFLKKVGDISGFLLAQNKNIPINPQNMIFFTVGLKHIKDPTELIVSAQQAQTLEYPQSSYFALKGLQGTLGLHDIAMVIEGFANFQEFDMEPEAFVDNLIDMKYQSGLDSVDEKSNQLIRQLYSKDIMKKLAYGNPEGLKLLFMFSFKLNQDTILRLRENYNIYFDIISLLAANNHSGVIPSIFKKLASHLNVIFKNKQGLYEECVASIFEYMDQCRRGLHEVVEEWSASEGIFRIKKMIEFSECFSLFLIILNYPLEIYNIQQTLLSLGQKEVTNVRYNCMAYCCSTCGKKTTEAQQIIGRLKDPHIQCKNCRSEIECYSLNCDFKIEVPQDMSDYIVTTAKNFSGHFQAQVLSLQRTLVKNNPKCSTLNAIVTDFEALAIVYLQHLAASAKKPPI